MIFWKFIKDADKHKVATKIATDIIEMYFQLTGTHGDIHGNIIDPNHVSYAEGKFIMQDIGVSFSLLQILVFILNKYIR